MNILLVSSFLPFPLYSGGDVRLYNIIKELSRTHTVTLVCERRHHQSEKDIAELKKICNEVYTVDRKKQWSSANIFKTAFTWYPFLLTGHFHPEMKRKISELLSKETYDLIHVETFYIMHNLPNTLLPTVLVEHNIEYLVYQRYIQTLPRILVGLLPLLYFDIAKIKYWEEKFWKKATKLVAVSGIEQKKMKRNDVALVPNGVDITNFAFSEKKRSKKVLFIGSFKWIANQDAVNQIITQIWPKIKEGKEGDSLTLWIVGKEIPQQIKNLSKDTSIIFDEHVEDAAKAFQEAHVLLAPIRVGGGTKFKVLEAMASGLPVVTTALGIEGIDAHHKEEVLIGDTSKELARLVQEITGDRALYTKIQKKARKLIEDTYDWKSIVKKLESVYVSAIK